MATVKYQPGGVKAPIDGQTTIEVSRVRRGRLTGFLFETAKTFLLPSALHGIRALVRFYREQPHLLVSGHTDTMGADDYNRGLSCERADSVAAYLKDDVERWMKWYAGSPTSNAWGVREDQHMLSSVGHPCAVTGTLDTPTRDAYRGFQRANGVAETGQGDNATRRALIQKYMAQDGTTLPASCALETHGCGEWHGEVPTGDQVDEPKNRRVEVFLFEGDVDPPAQNPCPRPGCAEYPIWVRRSVETVDFGGEPATLVVTVTDRSGAAIADAEVKLRGVVDADGTTDGNGVYRAADLPPGSYTLIAQHDEFFSDEIPLELPSGETQKRLEIADVSLVVLREGQSAHDALHTITCQQGEPLYLHWRIRNGKPVKVELGNPQLGKRADVTYLCVEREQLFYGFIPLTVEAAQQSSGTARYELTVTRGTNDPVRDVKLTLTTGSTPPGRRYVIAPELDGALELGLVRVRYVVEERP